MRLNRVRVGREGEGGGRRRGRREESEHCNQQVVLR
jgi:hypothetical protein